MKKELSIPAILLRLHGLIWASLPGFFVLLNVLAVAHGLSWGLNTLVFQRFFDAVNQAVTGAGTPSAIYWQLAAVAGITFGGQILNGAHNFLTNIFGHKMMGFLSKEIYRKASRLDPIAFEDPAVLDDINKAHQGMGSCLHMLAVILFIFTTYLPYFLFMGWYLYSVKPSLALSIVIIFIPVALAQLIRTGVYTKLEDESAPLRREYEYYERCICHREYFKETRLLGAFTYFRRLYQDTLQIMQEKKWKAELRTGLLELATRVLTLVGYMGVLYMLFAALLQGEISVGAFAAIFASVDMMFAMAEEVVGMHIGTVTQNLGTVRNFLRFLEIPERTGKEVAVDPGKIILEGVSFRYPNSEKDAVSDINLEIYPGETLAIVGSNGAGKSTLVKLLTGLYLPTEGIVRFGGVPTNEVSPDSLFRRTSAVFQKYQRYQMTLGDNIAISEPEKEKSNELLHEAAQKGDLEPDSEAFPKGFETMLSREFDGVDLSGGQWQRVAIARGFYRNHDLIVLDEPTAAIDPLEETLIYRKFAEMATDKTAVIVTHRLGSARIADRIAVMDQGRIAAIGTHEELLRSGGVYAEMYHAQAKWYHRESPSAL